MHAVQCASNTSGRIADTIPQLALQEPTKWGVSVCTVDGQRFSIGHVKEAFTMQAISKPITYAVTLSELGEELVHKYQGREPSGRKINEIVLDYNSNALAMQRSWRSLATVSWQINRTIRSSTQARCCRRRSSCSW